MSMKIYEGQAPNLHCNEPMELTGFIDKSDDVYEHYFECPECLMEKLIKSFK